MKLLDKLMNKFIPVLLILFPFIDVLTSLQVRNNIGFFSVGTLVRGLFLILIILYLIKKKVDNKALLIFILYFILSISYVFLFTTNSLYLHISNLFEIFYLPFLIIFFKKYENEKINDKFIFIIYLIFLNLIVIPKILGIGFSISEIYKNKHGYCGLFYSGNEVSAIILGLMPIVLNYVFKLKNYIIKALFYIETVVVIFLLGTKTLFFGSIIVIGYYLAKYLIDSFKNMKKTCKLATIILPIILVLCLIVYMPKTSVYKNIKEQLSFYKIDDTSDYVSINTLDKVVFSSRITFLKAINKEYKKSNIFDQIYGLSNERISNIKDIEIDIFDIFYSIGILGSIVYILLMLYALKKTKLKGYYKFSFVLFILMSMFSGHVLTKPMVSIYIALLFILSKNNTTDKKKILLVSNMYPNSKFKHYGVFVQNTEGILNNNGFIVDKVVMTKQTNKIFKLLSYIYLHLMTIIKGMFNDYDYIYVHFVSHSSLGAVFIKKTSKDIKLVLNAHGNDVVMDMKYEAENIKRSKKYMPYADKIIVPSKYYRDIIVNDYKINKNKVFIYPSGGVDTKYFIDKNINTAKKACKLNTKFDYIGYISRLEKNKGWDTFLESIKILKDEKSLSNTKFLIVGNGSEEEKMYKMIKDFDIEDLIEIRKFASRDELVNIYNSLKIFVFPTYRKSESLGLVGLEAMSCKTPLIVSKNYGPTDYVVDKKNALFFKPQDAKDLVKKIKELQKLSKKELDKMLKNARETAIKYDSNNTKDMILEVFK